MASGMAKREKEGDGRERAREREIKQEKCVTPYTVSLYKKQKSLWRALVWWLAGSLGDWLQMSVLRRLLKLLNLKSWERGPAICISVSLLGGSDDACTVPAPLL